MNDNPTVGAVVIGRPDSGFDLFACARLSRDSIHVLSKAYKRMLVAAKLRGAAETESGGGYWLLIDWNQYCGTQDMSGKVGGWAYSPQSGGVVVNPYVGTNTDCYTVLTYGWVPDDGGGGGSGGDPGDGGGGGTGFPDNPPPNPLPVPVSVTVSPSNITMSAGDYSGMGMVTATVTYSDGSVMMGPTAATWSVSGGNDVLATDDIGTFHAFKAGTATITATAGSVSGSATVNVTDDTPDFDLSDTNCTARNLRGCAGRPMNSTQLAAVRGALDTQFVRDTGACHDVRAWILSRPDSLLRDGQNYSMSKNGNIRFSGDIGTQSVIAIYNPGWNGSGGQSLPHIVMHEGFHWWAATHNEDYSDNPYNGGPSLVDRHATGCIRAESP